VRVASGRGGFLQDSRLGRAHTRMPRTLARKPVGAFSARQNCSITPLNWVRARHHELDGCFNRHFSGLVLGPTRSAQRAAASLTFLHRQDSALICRARGTIFACLLFLWVCVRDFTTMSKLVLLFQLISAPAFASVECWVGDFTSSCSPHSI
jgi:hypothetical protein